MKRTICAALVFLLLLSLMTVSLADASASEVVLANTRLRLKSSNRVIYTEFTNNSSTPVDRVDFACIFLDAYGEFADGATIHKCFEADFFLNPIAPGRTSNTGYYWTFYSVDSAVKAYVVMTRYHLTDGTTVDLIDFDSLTITSIDEFKALPGVIEVVLTK